MKKKDMMIILKFFVDNGILQGRAISAMADIDYQMYSLLNQIPAAIKDAR